MRDSRQMPLFGHDENINREGWFSKAIDILGVSESPGWPDVFGEMLKSNLCNSSQPVKTLSLFSGAGGLDIGFHDAGFDIVECNEIEDAFAATLIKNSKHGSHLQGTNIVCQDINDYNPSFKAYISHSKKIISYFLDLAIKGACRPDPLIKQAITC